MSGYYPPGVTGREPQIAGMPEGVEHMECSCGWSGKTDVRYDTYEAVADCPQCDSEILKTLPTAEEGWWDANEDAAMEQYYEEKYG